MSRSIAYNGTDFSPWTTVEALLPAAHGVAAEATEVPGRPGAVPLSASGWSSLFEDGSCELSFLTLDPVAWGEEKGFGPVAVFGAGAHGFTVDGVGGTAPIWPVFEPLCAHGRPSSIEGRGRFR